MSSLRRCHARRNALVDTHEQDAMPLLRRTVVSRIYLDDDDTIGPFRRLLS